MGVANLLSLSAYVKNSPSICRHSHGKPSANPTTEEGVGRNSAVGVHLVNINDVVQPLQEHHHDTRSDRRSSDDLWPRSDVRAGSPGKPEHADGQEGTTNDHRQEALFWHNMTVLFEFAGESSLCEEGDDETAADDADEDGQEGEGTHAKVPSAFFLEGDGEDFEEAIDDSCWWVVLAFCFCPL